MTHQYTTHSEALLRRAIAECTTLSPDASRVFDLAFEKARPGRRRRMVVPGWHCSTLNSRLDRDGLPSVTELTTTIRKAHAANLFDRYTRVADVAYALDASSPQSFGRWIRTQFGMTPTAFRATVTWPCVRVELIDRLVAPHAAAWATWTYGRRPTRQIAPRAFGAPAYARAA